MRTNKFLFLQWVLSCIRQWVTTRLPQVSPLQKAPRLPGFSMEEKQTPAPASKPKSERALEGWKWWHNMKKMLFAWNVTTGIHSKRSAFATTHKYLIQDTHQIMSVPRQNFIRGKTSNPTTKQATRNARPEQQPDFLQPLMPKAHMLFSLSATTHWLSEKCKISSYLLRKIEENRGNWIQFLTN